MLLFQMLLLFSDYTPLVSEVSRVSKLFRPFYILAVFSLHRCDWNRVIPWNSHGSCEWRATWTAVGLLRCWHYLLQRHGMHLFGSQFLSATDTGAVVLFYLPFCLIFRHSLKDFSRGDGVLSSSARWTHQASGALR